MKILKYFCDEDHIQIAESKSLSDILKVANVVLDRMPESSIFQVCGPISTGKRTVEENILVFVKTIEVLFENQLEVFNQMPFEKKMGELQKEWYLKNPGASYYMPLLEEFYKPIFETGKIKKMVFIPGWEHSFGASWEHDQANQLGIDIIYLPDNWVVDFDARPILELNV